MSADAVRQVAATFEDVAPDYDQSGVAFFTPIAARLVSLLSPAGGERAVDLGCGRGAATVPMAEAVGPSGTVAAVDLAPSMVAATRAAVAGSAWVSCSVADAADPPLPEGQADVVAASLVLFFLPDPAAAVRRWLGLLRPGGRIGVTTFGAQDDTWTAVDALFAPYLPPQLLDARTSGRAGAFASSAGVERLLEDARADTVRTVEETLPVRFADVEQWRRFSLSTGQRRMWALVPEAERPGLIAAAAALLETTRTDDGAFQLTQIVRYTLARRVG